MTICIAATCEDRYAILVTDKLISMSQANLEFESDFPKVHRVASNCMLAHAGSIAAFSRLVDVMRSASPLSKTEPGDIRSIAESVRSTYVSLRNAKLDEEILYPMGLDLRAFYQSNLSIRPEIVIPVVQRMEKYDLRLWVLVTGVDDSAHVYKVGNPGRLINYDRLGYHAIGTGEVHAIRTFVKNSYSPRQTPLAEALGTAYEAKKRSEEAQSVGEETEMFVLGAGAMTAVPPEVVRSMDALYREKTDDEARSAAKTKVIAADLSFMK